MAALRERFDLGPARTPQTAALPRSAAPAEGQAVPAGPTPRQTDRAKATDNRAPAAVPSSGQAKASGEARIREDDAGAQKWPLILACFVLLVAAAAAFGWWLQRSTAPRMASPPSAQPAPQTAQPATPAVAPQPAPSAAPASAVPTVATPMLADAAASASAAAVAPAVPAPAAPPQAVAPAKTGAPAPNPAVSVRATAARASAVAAPVRPAPARPAAPEYAPQTTPAATAQPAPPALDTKRFECEVLVRAGQKALANRSYDDAMQRADEALAVFADCPGAAELGRTARQAKDRARSSAVIQ